MQELRCRRVTGAEALAQSQLLVDDSPTSGPEWKRRLLRNVQSWGRRNPKLVLVYGVKRRMSAEVMLGSLSVENGRCGRTALYS